MPFNLNNFFQLLIIVEFFFLVGEGVGGGTREDSMRDETERPALILDMLSLLFHIPESLKNYWNCYDRIAKWIKKHIH